MMPNAYPHGSCSQYQAQPYQAYPQQLYNSTGQPSAPAYFPPPQGNFQQGACSNVYPPLGYGSIAVGKKPKYMHVGPLLPSLKADFYANPSKDAEIIYEATRRIGCDEKIVINILTRRSCVQREQIKAEYCRLYKKDLINVMEKELKDPFERVVISLLYTGPDLDAYLLKKATEFGTDERAIINILTTRSCEQLNQIKDSYQKIYRTSLEKHISFKCMGSLGKMASFLLHTPRDGCQYTDLNEAVKIAKDLHRQSSVQIKAPDSLTPLFCKTNYVQLSLIMQEYTKLSGKSLYHHIKGYSEGSYEKALMAICNYTANPLHYFSKHLSEGIKKKNINQVCRVVCTRFEIDLVSIQQDYMATYNREAAEDIRQAFGSSMKSTIEALESLMGR